MKKNFVSLCILCLTLSLCTIANAYVRTRCFQNSFTGFYVGGVVGYGAGKGSIINLDNSGNLKDDIAVGMSGITGGPYMGYGKTFSSKAYIGLKANYVFSGIRSQHNLYDQGGSPFVVSCKTPRFVDISILAGTLINHALIFIQGGWSNGRWVGRANDQRGTPPFKGDFLQRYENGWNVGLGSYIPISRSFFFQLSGTYNIYKKNGLKNSATITLKPQTYRIDVGFGFVI